MKGKPVMAKNRTIQHRPTEKSKNKELSDLKKENHGLRRKVAKLQKYLQKSLDSIGEPTEPEVVQDVNVPEPAPGACPQCGNIKVGQLTLPGGSTLRACKNCGWKRKT